MFAGHIKVLDWPHVAQGPGVAQRCQRAKKNKPKIWRQKPHCQELLKLTFIYENTTKFDFELFGMSLDTLKRLKRDVYKKGDCSN